jgi:sec-independent protein translocase protein TatA
MVSVLAIFNVGGWEILLILGIVLLLFGATKLPKLARSMGQSVGEFKKGLREGHDEVTKETADPGTGTPK